MKILLLDRSGKADRAKLCLLDIAKKYRDRSQYFKLIDVVVAY
jgi:hypothetical protein